MTPDTGRPQADAVARTGLVVLTSASALLGRPAR
jgi:hypothetical protein